MWVLECLAGVKSRKEERGARRDRRQQGGSTDCNTFCTLSAAPLRCYGRKRPSSGRRVPAEDNLRRIQSIVGANHTAPRGKVERHQRVMRCEDMRRTSLVSAPSFYLASPTPKS